jgi:NAD dependent epimerase/dehydratase family enzyme
VNATAPTPVRNAEFATALGATLARPAILRTPAFALRLALGEMADMLLTGQRVVPAAATALGFRWRYPDLVGALRASVRR